MWYTVSTYSTDMTVQDRKLAFSSQHLFKCTMDRNSLPGPSAVSLRRWPAASTLQSGHPSLPSSLPGPWAAVPSSLQKSGASPIRPFSNTEDFPAYGLSPFGQIGASKSRNRTKCSHSPLLDTSGAHTSPCAAVNWDRLQPWQFKNKRYTQHRGWLMYPRTENLIPRLKGKGMWVDARHEHQEIIHNRTPSSPRGSRVKCIAWIQPPHLISKTMIMT